MVYLSFATALAFFICLVWYFSSNEGLNKRIAGLAAIISILLNCVFSLYPIQEAVRLGLDLKGGTSYLIELQGNPSAKAVDQAIEVIRKRIDPLGVSEPIIQPIGANRISVQIPGLEEKDKESKREQLSKVAKLEFRLVHPETESLASQVQDKKMPAPVGYELLNESITLANGKKLDHPILVSRRVEMSGQFVTRAFRSADSVGRPEVVIQFNSEGQQLFGKITSDNVGARLAIVLDREVKSAPEIKGAIFNNATISGGNMNPVEAEELASVLENPLETPVKILEERGVDPSLGKDSIESGWKAGLIAFAGVITFMVIYYRLAGAISVVALVVNLIMLLGFLAQFHFTLTLPGIAGIVLTIGMAVDANVLIYERIRDELDHGTPVKNAIDIGFHRAFSAIFDSNVTTLIPAVAMICLGSGPLQGFAVTLTLGIVANLFAALIVSKNCFDWILSSKKVQTLRMMRFLTNPSFDFLKVRWLGVGLSVVILVGGFTAFTQKGSETLGVDFTGGDAVTLKFAGIEPPVEVGQVRAALAQGGIHASMLQYSDDKTQGKLLVQTKVGEGKQVTNILQQAFPKAGFNFGSLDSVGSQVGQEIKNRAVFALLLGIMGILVYAAFRFEWSFAVAAAVGQLHDVFIALSIMAILGRELTLPLVGAFLTIAGYSINDKIVVFDRIREGVRLREKGTFYESINRSLNLTLARTLLTGGTMIISTCSLILFGGSVIHDFSVAMLIGILSGIYSSHFISPPLAWWIDAYKEKKGRKASRKAAVSAA